MGKIIQGDAQIELKKLKAGSIHCVVTSPPYFGLRDYGMKGQIGHEKTPQEYVDRMVEMFREIRRAMRDDGTVWLNLGDSYAGSWGNYSGKNRGAGSQRIIRNGSIAHQRSYDGLENWRPPASQKLGPGIKPKDLIGIPWRVALALQADGWYLRQDIIWSKTNPMPESVMDRCTKSHEYIFLLSKSRRYHFDHEAIKEPTVTRDNDKRDRDSTRLNKVPGRRRMQGLKTNDYEKRNKRSVWTVSTKPYKGAHFATFPIDLIEPCILAGCPKDGIVLDPFLGSGTTAAAAQKHGRDYIGIELNPAYIKLAEKRLSTTCAKAPLDP